MGFLTKTGEHGLRAMIYMARGEAGVSCSVRRIAGDLDAPFHYLSKILQRLGEAGLLKTVRGVGGGVTLARPAKDISLYDIVTAIEGDELFTRCFLGLPGCGEQAPCAMHAEWAIKRRQLYAMFKSATLAHLALRKTRL